VKRPRWSNLPIVWTACVILLFGLAAESFAKPYPVMHRGVRPLGMGGAFTAVADDENALFYNPAGLSALKGLEMGILNPIVEVSKKSLDLIKDADDTDFDDTGEVADLMRKYIGEHQHARLALYPHVGFKMANVGAMIGFLAQGTVDIDIRNPAWPEAHTGIVQDFALLVGAGFPVPVKGLKLGLAAKAVKRKSLEEVYTAVDIAADDFEDRLDDDLKSGSGFSFDIGVIYKLPFFSLVDTSVGLAVLNVPSMNMGDAREIDTQANIGLALQKTLAKFKFLATLDYMDLTRNIDEDSDFAKRLHMGLELQTPFFISLRTGLNQGYWTGGATVDFRILRLDFATYAEEVGAYAGQRSDRRYIGQFSLGW
jgi:hypothetical protein